MERYFALSRTSHALLDMAAPAFCALLWLGHFPDVSTIMLSLLTAFAAYTTVYALNDLVGVQTDRQKFSGSGNNPGYSVEASPQRHPVAQNLLSMKRALIWMGAWFSIALVGSYVLNPLIVPILLGAAIVEVTYCQLLKVTFLRFLLSGVVKTSGPIAAVFAVDPKPSPHLLLLLFAWLFFWEIGGQNVASDWNDTEQDRRVAAQTVPLRFGFEKAGILEPRAKQDTWTPGPLIRPPVLCAGCPHTSAYMAVRAAGARVAGDIGCYTLACLDPLRGMDTTVSMGSSIGNAVGMAKAGETKPVVATIGDSTFLHAGIPQLINAVYNQANIAVVLLDNHITAMTGGQHHPGTGKSLRGDEAPKIDYEALVRACGVKWVRKVDSYDLAAMHQNLRDAINHRGVAVLIADRPCVLDPVKIKGPPFEVVQEQCNACQACMNLGCPAITWSAHSFEGRHKVQIDQSLCIGCTLCAQVCAVDCIKVVAPVTQ